MTITCFIRYEIDPFQKDLFKTYADNWARIIPRLGGHLSLSFWRDEAAVQAWRNHAAHRVGQVEGRDAVFADYRIRVAQVVRDYTLAQRQQAPCNSNTLFGGAPFPPGGAACMMAPHDHTLF